ncbi:hypothetical protein U9M48_000651 [Paspalum notatum var. saurae]|uniref:DDE Tnp4 domain-containing protein n=1 Tax=Paspalum notatum var. saurae TaxID=547442 RepID=A0AAQ3PMT9_PASNO
MPYFKDCIGAIDGTHITITMSPNFQDPYGSLSQNVMVAGDFNCQFAHMANIILLLHTKMPDIICKSKLHNHVECIIGTLKMHFPILKCASYYPIDTQRDIVLAACVLHTFIKKNDGSDQCLNEDGIQVNPSDK